MCDYTILVSRDDLRRYQENNPVLEKRELVCVYKKHGKVTFKLGDGVSRFNDLKYITKINDLLPYFCVYPKANNVEKVNMVLDPRGVDYEKHLEDK